VDDHTGVEPLGVNQMQALWLVEQRFPSVRTTGSTGNRNSSMRPASITAWAAGDTDALAGPLLEARTTFLISPFPSVVG
jgi:hypothetical protein